MERKGDKITILDATCRDGMHAVAHQFTPEQVGRIAAALEKAGPDYMEVSHGDGLGGSSITYGRGAASDGRWLAAARRELKNTRLSSMLLPGIGTMDDLRLAADEGVEMVRITVHCTEADITAQHIALTRELSMKPIGVLMMTHMVGPEKLLEQGRILADNGAEAVYLMDSAGHLLPDGVRARVSLLAQKLPIEVGFHAHANLDMHIANSIAALEEGASYLDGTLKGLGAGAGNAPIEVLAAVMTMYGYESNLDLYAIEDAADDVLRPMLGANLPNIDKVALTIGYAGVYSSFSLHAKRAAANYGVDARDIMMECGRRKVVGGQEDIIIEVAAQLAEQKKSEGERL
ncbi:MAG: 4-hydroxy-2-oxovalerate aldolase [Candidatus Adiutrix sp.]|jgi:4-hydroxy 2-oxovalerate aldolase|nr:4-hydroxy-2-oxovalerate aldolase [Candidatus Adiutrix sp.]